MISLARVGNTILKAWILGTLVAIDESRHVPCVLIGQGVALAQRHVGLDELKWTPELGPGIAKVKV